MQTRAHTVPPALRRLQCLRWALTVLALLTPSVVSSQVHEQSGATQIKAFPALGLTPLLTIDEAALDARHVSAVTASAAGDIIVTDGAERLIVFSATGIRLRTIGRAGAGPGEFRGPLSVGWLHDTVVVLDQRQRRVSLFSLQTGTLLVSFPWSLPGRPDRLLNGGASLFAVLELRTGAPRPIFGGSGTMPPLAEFGIAPVSGAGIGARLAQLGDSVDRMTASDCEDVHGGIWSFDPFFPDHGSMRALTPKAQLVSAARGRYLLVVRQAGRPDPVATISGPAQRWPVTDAIWDSVAAKYRATEKTAGITRCAPPVIRPAVLPPIRGMATDGDGNVWVEVSDKVGTALNGMRPDGRAVGAFHLPPHDESVPWTVRDQRLYLVLVDADGLQSVQVYRIDR